VFYIPSYICIYIVVTFFMFWHSYLVLCCCVSLIYVKPLRVIILDRPLYKLKIWNISEEFRSDKHFYPLTVFNGRQFINIISIIQQTERLTKVLKCKFALISLLMALYCTVLKASMPTITPQTHLFYYSTNDVFYIPSYICIYIVVTFFMFWHYKLY
jgi:hypothetical protein